MTPRGPCNLPVFSLPDRRGNPLVSNVNFEGQKMGIRGKKSIAQILAPHHAPPLRYPAPPGLSTAETARWAELAGTEDAQHFRAADLTLLRIYVSVLVRLDAEAAALAAEGSIETSPSGRRRANPRCALVDALVRQAATLASKLRLAPASRGPRRSAEAPMWQGMRPAILFREGNP